jgi:hypothetical protein
MSKVLKKPKFKCEHCARIFQTFIGLSEHTHLCEFGRRSKLQNTEDGLLAHKLWCISFKSTMRKKYEYSVFIKHREYKFFFSFAEFCNKVKVLDAEEYMNWCIKERIRSKQWVSECVYEKFVRHFLVHEDPIDAVIRSINYIKGLQRPSYFKTIMPGTFLTTLEVGKISPWLYLLYWDSNAILIRMNEDHLKLLNKIVDPSIWSMMQRRHKDVCDEIKKTLKRESL